MRWTGCFRLPMRPRLPRIWLPAQPAPPSLKRRAAGASGWNFFLRNLKYLPDLSIRFWRIPGRAMQPHCRWPAICCPQFPESWRCRLRGGSAPDLWVLCSALPRAADDDGGDGLLLDCADAEYYRRTFDQFAPVGSAAVGDPFLHGAAADHGLRADHPLLRSSALRLRGRDQDARTAGYYTAGRGEPSSAEQFAARSVAADTT